MDIRVPRLEPQQKIDEVEDLFEQLVVDDYLPFFESKDDDEESD